MKKALLLLIVVVVLMTTTSYAYYSKEHKFYAAFPSEPRVKTHQFMKEGTEVKIADYQSVDKTGIYRLAISILTPPAKDDTFKEGFLKGALETSVGNGQLIYERLDKSQHQMLYVYKINVGDIIFTVSGTMFFATDSILLDANTMFPSKDIKERIQNHTNFMKSIHFEK